MKHKQGNVAKYFGVEAGDEFRNLALSYTKDQYINAHNNICDLSDKCPPRLGLKQNLYEYIFGLKDGQKKTSNTSRVIPKNREYEYCRYIRLQAGKSCYNFASTAAGEACNRSPGSSRSPFGRGYLRLCTHVYCSFGYYIWYYASMKTNYLIVKNDKDKFLTPYMAKLLISRLRKIKHIHGISNANTIARGASVSTETIHDNEERTNYTITFPRSLHRSNGVGDFPYGRCTCGLYQAWRFPCKHAVFVIYSRVSQDNNINEISQTTIERVSQYIVEKNLCCPKYTKSRYLDFLENKIKIKDIEVPDLEKLVSTRHIARIRMPRPPLFNMIDNEIYDDKWHHANKKYRKKVGGVKERARKKDRNKPRSLR